MRNPARFPLKEGLHSRQAHADLPEQAIYEREVGREGFSVRPHIFTTNIRRQGG